MGTFLTELKSREFQILILLQFVVCTIVLFDVPVIRPVITETTALGAAYAAGLAVGLWKDLYSLRKYWKEDRTWTPAMNSQVREKQYYHWKKAVSRTFNWLDD